MDISLKVHHKLEAIPIIRNFVMECAVYYGADKKESYALGLVAEESAENIIKLYPTGEVESPFDITCKQIDNMLRITFSNTGLPVDVESLPQYDIDNPERSIDGLSFFLMDKLTDNFKFENRGAKGWRTIIEKKLKLLEKIKTEQKEEEKFPSIPSGKLSMSIALPTDAYEITKLAYYTYRYSYTKKAFYYPEVLKESLANQQIISLIVKNEKEEVIAHSALLRSENCNEIAEVGAIMAMPEYRNSTAVLRLVKGTNNFLKGSDNPGINLVESNLVTAHTGSQRLCRSFKFTPLALKISMHERADFIDIEDISSQRETLLYSVLAYKKITPFHIYSIDEHKEIISKILTKTGLPFNIKKSYKPYDYPKKTQYKLQRKDDSNFTRIVVLEIGSDLFTQIKKISYDLAIGDMVTVALKIPLSKPLPSDLDKQLNSINFFFSGIVPLTTDKWQALYTCLHHHRIYFDQIKVVDELAIELKDYVQNCYEKIIP
jgi:anti-sigma regulatory factor (Ser/Thr protein kinase)